MIALLDTNILIHAANAASRVHAEARRLRDQAIEGAITVCLTPQILWEFYSVVTSPRRVERPLAPDRALREMQAYAQAERITFIFPRPSTYRLVLDWLPRRRVTGRRIFDLYLVATMAENGVSMVYTENVDDFRGFPNVEALNPFEERVVRS